MIQLIIPFVLMNKRSPVRNAGNSAVKKNSDNTIAAAEKNKLPPQMPVEKAISHVRSHNNFVNTSVPASVPIVEAASVKQTENELPDRPTQMGRRRGYRRSAAIESTQPPFSPFNPMSRNGN